MNYRKWLIEDLQNLNRQRFAIGQLESELETVEAEFSAIKASNYDKMPSGSGDNVQEEKLLTAIAKKDELEKRLEFTRMSVKDLDRLLNQLPDDERIIIERSVINNEKYAAETLADELGYERRWIYKKKSDALMHLAQLRYGVTDKI